MINWKVRLKNKQFWVTIIPAIFLLVQEISKLFGLDLPLDGIKENVLAFINSVFTVLAMLGIITDPTTAGVSDSVLAMSYDEPKQE